MFMNTPCKDGQRQRDNIKSSKGQRRAVDHVCYKYFFFTVDIFAVM